MKKVNNRHIRFRHKITESSMTAQSHCQCSYFVSFIVLSQSVSSVQIRDLCDLISISS